MRKYVPGTLWTVVLVAVALFIPLGYITTSLYVEPAMKDYVRQNLPERLKTREISFNFLPLSVTLDESELETEESSTISVRSIEVNPNVRSMFSDTFVIDKLEFEGVSLSFYRTGQPDTSPLADSDLGSLFDAEGPKRNFRINRLILSNSKIQLLESSESTSPILDLSPINLELGPITPSRLKKGVSLDLVSGFQGMDKRVYLQGDLTVSPRFTLSGELRLNKFKPDEIPSYFLPGVQLAGGEIRGDLDFTYSGETLDISAITVALRDSTMDFPEPTAVRTILEPDAGTVTKSGEPSWVTVGDIQLELSDVSINVNRFVEQTTPTPLLVNEGLIKAGPYHGTASTIPILGQLILRQPSGLFEFKTNLALDRDPYRFDNFISDFRIDRVDELNPYLGTLLPVRLRTGSMTGGVKGAFSADDLNLDVALDFNRLKMGTARTGKSTFLGVPLKIYLDYLSKNEGNLELSFHLSGSPASPTVEVNSIRNRILVNLGVDAAVLTTIGLPAYLGDKVLERTTCISLINEARNTFSKIFMTPRSAEDPPALKPERKKTPIPPRKNKTHQPGRI